MLRVPIVGGRTLVTVSVGPFTTAGSGSAQAASATFLVDTGATHSHIDTGLAARLSLSLSGTMSIRTASSGGSDIQAAMYLGKMWIDLPPRLLLIPAIAFTSSDLSHLGIDGLLGWDILKHLHMTYDGPNEMATLAIGGPPRRKFGIQ